MRHPHCGQSNYSALWVRSRGVQAKNPLLWKFISGILLFWVATGLLSLHAQEPNPNIDSKQRQLKRLIIEKGEIQEKLAFFKASETLLKEEIAGLKEVVGASKDRKNMMEQKVGGLTKQIKEKEKTLGTLVKKIRISRSRLKNRLRRLYRMTKQSHASNLFQVARFSGFARDAYYLSKLQEADREAMVSYQSLALDLRTKKTEIERSMSQVDNLNQEIGEENNNLKDRETFLRASLKDLVENRKLYTKYLSDLEKMMEGMETALKKIETDPGPLKPPENTLSPKELKGSMPLPTPGRLIVGFGEQDPRYDLKKEQRGLVFRVNGEVSVKASAGGRAVHAGSFRGYQELVVLDHGNGLFTVYGHLKDLTVRRGQWVPRGGALGSPTYQSVDDAYNVYFEIRYKGKPEDPTQWLEPGVITR